MTGRADGLRGHVPMMRVTLPISASSSSTCAGIKEVSLYITALVHHLWGMSERNGAWEISTVFQKWHMVERFQMYNTNPVDVAPENTS